MATFTRVPVRQVEIDFGSLNVLEKIFTISDPRTTASSNIIGNIAYVAPTGRDLDEVEMEPFNLRFQPGIGSFKVFIQAHEGPVYGKYKLNYYLG